MSTSVFDLQCRKIPIWKQNTYRQITAAGFSGAYVLGRNKYADSVAQKIAIKAFVDDFTQDQMYGGYPVIRMKDIPPEAVIVSCVVDAQPLTALERLKAAGLRNVIDYFTLLRLEPERFLPLDHCRSNQEDVLAHLPEYKWVFDRLADESSRNAFRKVVQFRATLDLEHMRGFSLGIDRQYFEEFLELHPGEVFVDGGGFDGKTTRAFAAHMPDYRSIYFFEPMPEMLNAAQQALADLPRIHYIGKGISDRSGTVFFNDQCGSASRIALDGNRRIEVAALDKEVPEPITFLKLDIEGAELAAIEGASGQISANTPKLAVCIYHNQADFWQIPRRVLAINDRYQVYVRHYSEGILETVMFFVPRP